jgi:xanthine/uracil/vitamin C permease (AzgA family)
MKIGSFEFNLRELSGSMGDFGTLFPLAFGYIAVCGVDPSGLLVTMGLANIVTGLVYQLPMPIEPMKVLAVYAIAQRWEPSMVYASAFAMGIVWLLVAGTGFIGLIARYTPKAVVRGIQVALGILLAREAFYMMSAWWWLALGALAVIVLLKDNRYAPAAVVLIALGVVIMFFRGDLQQVHGAGFHLPSVSRFTLREVWLAMLLAGFAQIPLTATNAVISTSTLIKTYFPGRSVSERRLALNMGVMNLVIPFIGGMPLCHGAGGLAGQYCFGARTGGANIIEGVIEIFLGIFLAASIAGLFSAFPAAIIGAMMFYVGLEMVKLSRDIDWKTDVWPFATTVLLSVLTNMAGGFLAGLAVHYTIHGVRKHLTEQGRL